MARIPGQVLATDNLEVVSDRRTIGESIQVDVPLAEELGLEEISTATILSKPSLVQIHFVARCLHVHSH